VPTARITPDLKMHYEVDDYTDPWTQPETVLLLHGNAESAAMCVAAGDWRVYQTFTTQ